MNHNSINITKFGLNKGIGLIEVLVTITITSIGLMGLVSLQMQSVRSTSDSGSRSQAIWVFNDIVNRIHANEEFSDKYISSNPITCATKVTPVCSSYHNGTGVVNAAGCTGSQQAKWDRYEVACKLKPDPFIGDSSNYLPGAELSITCASSNCKPGDPLIIKLEWRARSDSEEITGSIRNADSGLLVLTDIITP